MFIGETVDKKDLGCLNMTKKSYNILGFILHEVLVTGTVDKTHLLVMSENDVEWPTQCLVQYLVLLPETVKSFEIDLLTDVEIEIKSEIEDSKLKGCSESFNFRKLLLREEKLSAFILTVEDLLTLGFKWSAKLFADKSCFQKWCIE